MTFGNRILKRDGLISDKIGSFKSIFDKKFISIDIIIDIKGFDFLIVSEKRSNQR